jgi:hypothetical protein
MNHVKLVIVSASLLVTGLLCTVVAAESAKPSQPASVSQTDAESAKAVDKETTIAGFVLRPPTGCVAMQPEGPEGMQTFAWKGAERADGSSPYLLALIITAPPGETEMPPLEVVLKQHLAGIERRRTEFAATKADAVKINGIEFLRARWSGMDKASDRKMHGLIVSA